MKPHLKLHTDGRVEILRTGTHWRVHAATDFIKRHYGTRVAFAATYGLNYDAVCEALRDDRSAVRSAGRIELVRKFLGLRSEPTSASRNLSRSYQKSRVMHWGRQRQRVFLAEGAQ